MTDELLIKYLLQETTVNEQETVERWLSSDQTHMDHFQKFRKIWEASKQLAQHSEVSEEEAWVKFKTKADQKQQVSLQRNISGRNYLWMKIAATLLLVTGCWFVYQYSPKDPYIVLKTGNNVQSDTLPDGTVLTLNKGTILKYASNFQKKRNILMESGDVFFKVAKDRTHPFVITINHITVTVIGTSFNIRHLGKNTEINVESGIVEVKRGKETLRLQKGDHLSLGSSEQELQKSANTDQLYNYYQSQLFIARNTPLPRLIATLNEAYNSNIKLAPGLEDITFSSTLKKGNLKDNLKIICETLDLQQSGNQQEMLLSKTKP